MFGGFLVAALVASTTVVVLGAGVASAAGTMNWTALTSPSQLRQNTTGNEFLTAGVVDPNNSRTVKGVVTEDSDSMTGITVALTAADVGRPISGECIEPGTYIDAQAGGTGTLSPSCDVRHAFDGSPSSDVATISAPQITGGAVGWSFDLRVTGRRVTRSSSTRSPTTTPTTGSARSARQPAAAGCEPVDPQAGNYVGFPATPTGAAPSVASANGAAAVTPVGGGLSFGRERGAALPRRHRPDVADPVHRSETPVCRRRHGRLILS